MPEKKFYTPVSRVVSAFFVGLGTFCVALVLLPNPWADLVLSGTTAVGAYFVKYLNELCRPRTNILVSFLASIAPMVVLWVAGLRNPFALGLGFAIAIFASTLWYYLSKAESQ